MVTVNVSGRKLRVDFRYDKKYSLEVPDPTFHTRMKQRLASVSKDLRMTVKAHFRRSEPRMMKVERPLTQVYLTLVNGPKSETILHKRELKLYFKDTAFSRKSNEMEKLRRFMCDGLLREARHMQLISDEEQVAIWDAIKNRYQKSFVPAPAPPGTTPPPALVAATTGRKIEVVDAESVTRIAASEDGNDADTIPVESRMVVSRRSVKKPSGSHTVINKLISFPGPWHYVKPDLSEMERLPGERVH